jgi:hypothetical protein
MSHILFHASPRLSEVHQRLTHGVRRLDEKMRKELLAAVEADSRLSLAGLIDGGASEPLGRPPHEVP